MEGTQIRVLAPALDGLALEKGGHKAVTPLRQRRSQTKSHLNFHIPHELSQHPRCRRLTCQVLLALFQAIPAASGKLNELANALKPLKPASRLTATRLFLQKLSDYIEEI